MNMKLDVGIDIKKILPVLRKLEPYLFGLALIGAFGYTAYIVNAAMNVKPAEVITGATATAKTTKIGFDKPTIEAIKKLQVVDGAVQPGDIGKHDPFK